MEAGPQTDQNVDHYNSLHPSGFNHLRRMELRQFEDHQELDLDLEGEVQGRRMRLTFRGIAALEFQPHGFQPVPLYLEIVWIGGRQWQGLNYQVFNMEQDARLSFYCRDFRVTVEDLDQAGPSAA